MMINVILRFLMVLIFIELMFKKYKSFSEKSINKNKNIYISAKYKYSIFFLESNYLRKEFTTKEMCAIESAAKMNPKALIQVHTFTAKLNNNANILKNIYPNIQITNFQPENVFNDTPILDWWHKGSVLKSAFSYSHLTDAFR